MKKQSAKNDVHKYCDFFVEIFHVTYFTLFTTERDVINIWPKLLALVTLKSLLFKLQSSLRSDNNNNIIVH